MNRRNRIPALAALALISIASARAADWPAWLGPRGDGSSPEERIFAGPDAPRLKVTWSRALGIA